MRGIVANGTFMILDDAGPRKDNFGYHGRYVQYITDCVTFVLSFFCCQCWEPLPPSECSAEFIFKTELPEDRKYELDQGCGEPMNVPHLVRDFNPGREDTVELQEKVCQFWSYVQKQPELGKPDSNILCIASSICDAKDPTTLHVTEDYPTVHLIRKLTENDAAETTPENC